MIISSSHNSSIAIRAKVLAEENRNIGDIALHLNYENSLYLSASEAVEIVESLNEALSAFTASGAA